MVMGELPEAAQLLVIGGGPGGYAAAFRAADLGLDVTLATEEERLGGVCLLRGCIPSKALLHLSTLTHEAEAAERMGIGFGRPKIDLERLRSWKGEVVETLTDGLAGLCKTRGIRLVHGRARFTGPDRVRIEGEDSATIGFEHAIVATGSRPSELPGAGLDNPRVMDSTGALALDDIPKRLLVIGGGYVGLELGQVYAALGSKVTLVEVTDRILPGADDDLVGPLARQLDDRFAAVRLETSVAGMEETSDGIAVTLESGSDGERFEADRVLVSVGRTPNTDDLGLDDAGVETDDGGFIVVDEQRRTAAPRIHAIGDAAGGMMLAHEAMHEGRVAAEAIAGQPAAFDARAVPAIVYTDPQVAWCGLSEAQAKREGREVRVARFPWRASGRALSMGAADGMTKLVLEPDSGRVLGMGAVGRQAEALIQEGVLAVEMGATAEDLALTIHAHPTLAETVGEASARFLGSPIHLPPGKDKGGGR